MAAGSRLGRFVVPLMAVVLAVAALSALPAEPAAGLACLCSVGFAGSMLWAVRTGRAAGPPLRTLALAGGASLTAAAAASGASRSVAAPDALVADVPLQAEIPLVSLFFVAALYLVGVLRPPQPRGPLARLRVRLDMVGLAVGLIFAPWLLLFGAGERRGATHHRAPASAARPPRPSRSPGCTRSGTGRRCCGAGPARHCRSSG